LFAFDVTLPQGVYVDPLTRAEVVIETMASEVTGEDPDGPDVATFTT
jgi:hypothetical protein